LVCEGPIERKTGNQKVCRRSKCRNTLRAGFRLGRYYPTSDVKLPSKSADFIGPKMPLRPDRASLIRNAIQTEFFGGGKWRELVSPDGVRCHVTRLWGKEAA
jgi:hypothetical protein